MDALRQPRALRRGATLGVAAPGGPVDPEKLAAGERMLEEAGFRVTRRDDLLARRGYLAGDDQRRIDELMQLVSDPEVDAIVCARGGYGCDRILDRLDPAPFREAAKPLVGYSDITALLLWQARQAGVAGFHGPMLDRGDDVAPEALAGLVDWLTGAVELPVVWQGEGCGGGAAEGRLTGGSLTLVAASLGTCWEVDTEGAILLLEDIGERPYRVDRMLQQLRGAGKLDGCVGIGFGDLTSCLDDKYGSRVDEVVGDIATVVGCPVISGLPFGHVRGNATWPMGGRAKIDAERGELRVLEGGVEKPS